MKGDCMGNNHKYLNKESLKNGTMGIKSLMFFMLFMFSFGFVVAEEAKLGVNNLQFTCTVNYQVPSPSATYNFSIYYQNGSTLIDNVQAQAKGQGAFNYTVNFPTIEDYTINSFCYDGANGNFSSDGVYEVTYTGQKMEIEETYIYILVLVFLVAMAVALWFVNSRISGEHTRDGNGNISLINFKGFLKPVVGISIWIIGMVCIFIIANLGLAFLPNPMIGNLFMAIYKIMFWLTIVGVPVSFVLMLVKIVKSIELQKMIERGVEVRDTK